MRAPKSSVLGRPSDASQRAVRWSLRACLGLVLASVLLFMLRVWMKPMGPPPQRSSIGTESGRSRGEVLATLIDSRPNSVKHPDRVQVCFELATILETGGVEAWFWALFDGVFMQPPFIVHAVQVRERSGGAVARAKTQHTPQSAPFLTLPPPLTQINALFSEPVVARFIRNGVIINPGHFYIADTCDVVIVTGTEPPPTFNLQRRAPRVLVIHGSKGCQWTWNYAKHAQGYERIVGVSTGALDVIDSLPEQRARGVVIPSGIDVGALTPSAPREELLQRYGVPATTPSGEKMRVLLYLGRISSEKNPGFFYEVVDVLPPNWVGLMVGPAYFDERCVIICLWARDIHFFIYSRETLAPLLLPSAAAFRRAQARAFSLQEG